MHKSAVMRNQVNRHRYSRATIVESHTSADCTILHCFIPSFAHAAPNGYHPLPIPVTVKLDGYIHLLPIGNTHPSGCHQRGALCSRQSLRKDSTILDHTGTFPVVDSNSDEWHAGTIILESEVEAIAWNRSKTPDFTVDLHDAATEVNLREALISSYSIHFHPGVLHPGWGRFSGCVRVRLIVVKVESFLAGARDIGYGTAVTHWELHLNMDTLSTTAADEFGAYPVVLANIKDVAHLVCSDGVHVFIIATNFFPLEDRQQTKLLIQWQQQMYKKIQTMWQ